MPLYKVTVTRTVMSNGIRLEKGMNVEVVTPIVTNPVSVNNGESVKSAFGRIYGIDLTPIWTIARSALDVKKIG